MAMASVTPELPPELLDVLPLLPDESAPELPPELPVPASPVLSVWPPQARAVTAASESARPGTRSERQRRN
jgi:hypothetical protein